MCGIQVKIKIEPTLLSSMTLKELEPQLLALSDMQELYPDLPPNIQIS
jgi:hypothetical protein